MSVVSSEFYKRAEALVRWGVNVGRVRTADAPMLPAVLVMMCRAPLLFLRQTGAGTAWNEGLTEQMVRFFSAAATSEPSRPAPPVARRARKPSPVGA